MPLPTPAPINAEVIKAEAQKAEFFHDDIHEACLKECAYPYGSLAHAMFKEEFTRARQVRNYGSHPEVTTKGAAA